PVRGLNSYGGQRLEGFGVPVVNTKERLQTTRRKFNFLQTLLTFSFNHMLPQSRTKCTKELSVAAFLRLLCFFAAVMGRLDSRYPDLYTPSLASGGRVCPRRGLESVNA